MTLTSEYILRNHEEHNTDKNKCNPPCPVHSSVHQRRFAIESLKSIFQIGPSTGFRGLIAHASAPGVGFQVS